MNTRPTRRSLVVGSAVAAVLIIGAVLFLLAATSGCGCQPNPDTIVTGVVTEIDLPSSRFTLQTSGGAVWSFQIPSAGSPLLQTVQDAYARHAPLEVFYARRQQAPPYSLDQAELETGAAATP